MFFFERAKIVKRIYLRNSIVILYSSFFFTSTVIIAYTEYTEKKINM